MQAGDKLLGDVHTKLDALTAAGLLTRTSHDGNLRYELTLTGQQVPGNGRFCYGKRQVTSVDNYSAPTEFHGNRFTKVDYHFVEKGRPDWAKVQAIQTAFPAVAKAVADAPVDRRDPRPYRRRLGPKRGLTGFPRAKLNTVHPTNRVVLTKGPSTL